jgi:transcriptional regulator with XRE-family HTH domain
MGSDIADHIRRARESLGWTQSELAQRARIDQGDLSRIERGSTDPRWSTVNRISAALGEAIVFEVPSTQRRPLSTRSRAAVRSAAGKTSLKAPEPVGSTLNVKH